MHPHIVRVYEIIETPTDIYVVMEYVKVGHSKWDENPSSFIFASVHIVFTIYPYK